MKILLIDPPGGQKGWNTGLAYLSGALERAGIEHAVLDMVNVRVPDGELVDFVRTYAPDLIGISVKTATYYSAVHVAQELKKSFPEIPLIAGGPHITLYHEEFLAEAECFDAAAVGDAEETLIELAGSQTLKPLPRIDGMAYREGGNVVCVPRKAPADLNALAFPQFDYNQRFDPGWQPYPLITSRGCPYGCIYCSVGRISGRKWRFRSPGNVVDEIQRAIDKWGFKEFDVLDDTFTQDVSRAREICRLIIDRNIDIKWSCPNGIRADRVTPELMSYMARAGCHTVIFGVETGDPELFKSINKSETLDDVARAIRLAKGFRMRVGGYFIIGLPGDSYDKNMKSLEFAKDMGLDWAHFNILAPYPGTKVWDEIEKRGRFLDDYRKAQHFSTQIKPVFELNDFSADEIIRTYKTVHVRQRLFHFMVEPGKSRLREKHAIRKLRAEYDRERWIKDIKRDIRKAAQPVTVPLRALRWDSKREQGSPPTLYPTRYMGDSFKVLMVSDYIGRAGGTEKYIYDLVENLELMGHKVAWAYQQDIGSENIDIPTYPMAGLMMPVHYDEVESRLDRILAEFEPDVIHIHNVHAPGIVRACLDRRPTIRTVHDHNIICPSMNKVWRTGDICHVPAGFQCIERLLDKGCHVVGMRPRLLLERLDNCLDGIEANRELPKILTTSKYMKDTLIQNGFDPARVEILPLFLDFPENVDPPDESMPLKILWAGRIVLPDKGADYFVDSLRYLRAPFKVIIAGDGPAMDFIRYKAHEELKLGDKVEFRGRVSKDEMEKLFRWCHVVAFSSMWGEPFGYVGVEAAAHCRPVVAFDTGGVSDWLTDREGGFLVYRGNTRAYALRLERIAYDTPSRAAMGRAHREAAAKKYDRAKHMKRLLDVYRGLGVQYSGGSRSPKAVHVPVSKRPPREKAEKIKTSGSQKTLAFFSPFSPLKSGVADYGAALAKELARQYKIVFYIDEGYIPAGIEGLGEVRVHTEYRGDEDRTLFQATNSPLSAYMYPYLLEGGAAMTLHDRTLFDMAVRYWEWKPRRKFWADFMRNEGTKGLRLAMQPLESGRNSFSERILQNVYFDEDRKRVNFAFMKSVVSRARGIIAHSRTVQDAAGSFGAKCPIIVTPLAVDPAPPDVTKSEARKALGLDEKGVGQETFTVLAYGFIQRHKRIEQLLEAWKWFVKKGFDAKLILLGPRSPDYDVDSKIEAQGLAECVVIDDSYPPMETVFKYIYASDLCVNLRYPVYGSSSYSLMHIMSAGRPCVVTDLETFSEFADDMVIKAPLGDSEIKSLVDIMEKAAKNPAEMEKVGKRAREYVETQCLWSHAGPKYVEFLEKIYA